jgi:hypothetical protein
MKRNGKETNAFLRKNSMKRVETSILIHMYSLNQTVQKTASVSTPFYSKHLWV